MTADRFLLAVASDPRTATALLCASLLKRELRAFDKRAKEGLMVDQRQRAELVILIQEMERRARPNEKACRRCGVVQSSAGACLGCGASKSTDSGAAGSD